MKVYCDNCRSMKEMFDAFGGVYFHCRKHKTKHRDAVSKWSTFGDCEDFNENNDCSDYQRKWWKFWIKKK